MNYDLNACREFYQGKKVLVTGHTGFKGSWLCRILTLAGAQVTGYAAEAPTDPALFSIAGLETTMDSVIGDIRDLKHLKEVFERVQPQIVLHLAAQPIVRDSYKDPVYTYETNVMGTVNVLECVRQTPSVKSFLNVTTDKVGVRVPGVRSVRWLRSLLQQQILLGTGNTQLPEILLCGWTLRDFYRTRG